MPFCALAIYVYNDRNKLASLKVCFSQGTIHQLFLLRILFLIVWDSSKCSEIHLSEILLTEIYLNLTSVTRIILCIEQPQAKPNTLTETYSTEDVLKKNDLDWTSFLDFTTSSLTQAPVFVYYFFSSSAPFPGLSSTPDTAPLSSPWVLLAMPNTTGWYRIHRRHILLFCSMDLDI